MDLREVINSVLLSGEKSMHLKCFVQECVSIALACLNNSKFKNEIYNKLNHSKEDIAVDLIGDLFKTESGKFVYIEKYFSGVDILSTENDLIKAKLNALIYSRSNQRISRIRMEFGEIFFSIEKAVNEYLKRNPEKYYVLIIDKKNYIYNSNPGKIISEKSQCNKTELLNFLFVIKYKTAQVPEIIENIFGFLNNQDDFNNIIELDFMITVITDFYKKRSLEHFL